MTGNSNGHSQQDDPFDSAANAQPRAQEAYGEIDVDCWYCILVKGTGKVAFDPAQHEPQQRATAIDLFVIPLADMNLSFAFERKMIAESREWASIVWPSLKALGATSVRDIKGRWCKAAQVPTGRKYRVKKGKDIGMEKEATTLKFLALYASEQECRDAYYAETPAIPASADDNGVGPIPGFEDDKPQATTEDKERETARQFLVVIIKNHSGDKAKTLAQIQTMPMITKFFADEAAIQAVIDDVYQEVVI